MTADQPKPPSLISAGALRSPLPALDDAEGERLPAGLPPLVDAHVHVFPDPLFASLWSWFDQYGWPIRYRLPGAEVLPFLRRRGVAHVLILAFAHRPGMARELNRFVADLCASDAGASGMATVFPGEADAKAIIAEGFELGLKGVKLHAHVQGFDMCSAEMRPVYEACVEHRRPLLMHVGREPKSPGYACDPHAICDVARLERVLRGWPELRVCVPHLGADEFEAYCDLLQRYDNLWVDTAMALADYLPLASPPPLRAWRADRVLYGSDFPNIPYAWDREIGKVLEQELGRAELEALLGGNAVALYDLKL